MIFVCNQLYSSNSYKLAIVHPSICLTWQKLKSWILHAKFLSTLFLDAMFIGTIIFYHFIPNSVALTLTEGHKIRNPNLLGSSFQHNWSEWNFISTQLIRVKFEEVLKYNPSWTCLYYLRMRFLQSRKIHALSMNPDTTSEWDFCNQRKWLLFYWLHSENERLACVQDMYDLILFELRIVIDTTKPYLSISLVILNLIQGHKGARKQIIAQSSVNLNGICYAVELVGQMNIILI